MSWTHVEKWRNQKIQQLSRVSEVGEGAAARTPGTDFAWLSSPKHRITLLAQGTQLPLMIGTVVSTVVFLNIFHKIQVLLVKKSFVGEKKNRLCGHIILGNPGLNKVK